MNEKPSSEETRRAFQTIAQAIRASYESEHAKDLCFQHWAALRDALVVPGSNYELWNYTIKEATK